MKDEILKREMFSKPMSKSSRNSGIMAGFEDEMEDEGTQPMARSPQNPEILMNNLRGDMRSVDARYLELAQMVGEQAAMETPPEVLAMLQSQFAAQAAPPMPQGGIGALPQGAEMAPPPMMGQGPAMPPGMEGMPPFPQGGAEQAPPQTFAGGGDVSATGELTLQFGNSSPFGNSYPFGNGNMFGASMPFSNGTAGNGTTFLERLQENQAQERIAPSASPLFPGSSSPSQSVNILMPSGAQQPSLTQDMPNLTGYTSQPVDAGGMSPAPFGTEQAPPTPDGMPPLRAADGVFVTQDARQSGSENIYDLYDPLYMPPRFDELVTGKIPEDQMTDKEKRFLKTYKFGMGFTGGSIRDVASQGMGRITSALSPYVQRGINYLDELATPFIRPGMRVAPMTEGGRRAVIQGRENIFQGPRGPEFSTGTRLQGANTLDFGRIPFSQAFRESGLGNFIANYPKSTLGGTTTAAGALYALSGDKKPPVRSAADLANVNKIIDQIPGQGPPKFDARGNRIIPPGRENEPFEVNFRDDRIVPPTPERPEDATINRLNTVAEPTVDFSPFDSMVDKTTKSDLTRGLPTKVDISNKTFIDENLLKEDKKEKPFLTRAQRIKAEYQETEPLFRELLGDTKSTTRTNALLLLADAGFKFASTYKPTMAMALADAFSGVPKGFAAIVAQAKDSGIKIKTAALQQAVSNVDTQDKISRDLMLQQMRDSSFRDRALINATSKKEVEELKARFKEREIILKGDQDRLTEAWKWGQPEVEDVGGGIQIYKWKNGETYTSLNKNSDIPTSFLKSRYTNNVLTSPYVTYRGPSAMTPLRDKASVKTALDDDASYELALREVDNLRTLVFNSYGPKTWAIDKYNNILVPLTFNTITPLVKEEALSSAIKLSAESISKSIANAGQSGRLSNQNIQYAREALGSLLNPTEFMKNPELAATVLSTLETRLRNGRQAVGEQLGYLKDELVTSIPATGSQNNPFVYGAADSEQAARMDMYLKTLYKGQDPNIPIYVNINGQTGRTTIGKILQAR